MAVEHMTGTNRYECGIHGFQDAERTVKFSYFPSILVLQLMRMDYRLETLVKLGTR